MTTTMAKSKQAPELSIIVISYNTKAITKKCIQSIVKSMIESKIRYELLIVDNNSSDGSQEMIKDYEKKYKNIIFIPNKINEGFAKANNRAAKISKGSYLLFLNSDVIVLEKAVAKLLNFLKTHKKTVHFAGGKLLNQDYSIQPSCGPFYTPLVVFGALFLRGDYWGLTRSSPNKVTETDWVSGACLLTKKEYYETLHGFDEGIFMYMDEVDLLYRAKKIKYNIFFYPQARFIHLGSASSNGKTYPILQVYRGLIYFYKKHLPGSIFLLRFMLKLKAVIGVIVGTLANNTYLKKTYGEAYKIA